MSLPAPVFRHRRRTCDACATPCGADCMDACAACPLTPPAWGPWDCGKVEMRGLGDAVAVVAQPIARTIDRVLGTNVAGCGGCKARQAALNRAVPFNAPIYGVDVKPS